MSVFIKGMEMPTSGELLVIITPNGEVRYKKSVASMWDRTTAVAVPPHGRCIDADALLMRINHEVMEAYMDGVRYGVHPSQEYLDLLGEIIDDAPTIIPAEPAEDGET